MNWNRLEGNSSTAVKKKKQGRAEQLASIQERHLFNLECEVEAEKLIKQGVAPWRATEAGCKIARNRRAKLQSKKKPSH